VCFSFFLILKQNTYFKRLQLITSFTKLTYPLRDLDINIKCKPSWRIIQQLQVEKVKFIYLFPETMVTFHDGQ